MKKTKAIFICLLIISVLILLLIVGIISFNLGRKYENNVQYKDYYDDFDDNEDEDYDYDDYYTNEDEYSPEDDDDNCLVPIQPGMSIVYKPIIYLYPTKDTNVNVKFTYNDKITVSYPQYTSEGWNIFAKTNGDLIDLKTKRNLYSLYYESNNIIDFKVEKEGFIVNSDSLITFFEEKLSILGLNSKETEEFIIYWLPILQQNKYNYIRFASIEEINKNVPLEVSPSPDTYIRILMTYKGLDNPITVKEQELSKTERNGYTLVEWGGTQIK